MNDTAQFVSNPNAARFVGRLRVERDPAARALLYRLPLKEWNNLAFILGQLCSWQGEVIGGRDRIAIQIAVV